MKIAVLTGSRADYGLLRWLMNEIRLSLRHDLLVIVTGTHLSTEHGLTAQELIDDGFHISSEVHVLMEADSGLGVAKSTGLGFLGFADTFNNHRPDLLVVLGDRYEAFAAVGAAFLMRVPVAHVAGGEVTEGALDDSLRHAMTKMAAIHFPSTEEYAQRIRQLGESDASIFVVGATGLDNLTNIQTLDREALGQELRFDLGSGPIALCTFHPETNDSTSETSDGIAPLLTALESTDSLKVIFTMANADEGGAQINDAIRAFVAEHRDRAILVSSLGQTKYLSALRHVDFVIGNSSSGITEAPSAGVPTVNIGDRQAGRLRAPSVIDVSNSVDDILKGIQVALSPHSQEVAQAKDSPFGTPGASRRIFEILDSLNIDGLPRKSFVDRI